jgi:hypothetical protein
MTDVTFGPAETVKVADLRVGDFAVSVPAQHNYRETRIDSGLATVTDEYDRWTERYGRRRVSIRSRRLTFLTRSVPAVSCPADWQIVVRRPLTQANPK